MAAGRPGGGDDRGAGAAGGVLGEHAAGEEGFVVRVGEHSEQGRSGGRLRHEGLRAGQGGGTGVWVSSCAQRAMSGAKVGFDASGAGLEELGQRDELADPACVGVRDMGELAADPGDGRRHGKRVRVEQTQVVTDGQATPVLPVQESAERLLTRPVQPWMVASQSVSSLLTSSGRSCWIQWPQPSRRWEADRAGRVVG